MTHRKTRSREGWTRVRFGDVVRLATERCADPLAAGIERYVGLEHLEPSDLRIRTWGNVADGVTFTNRFHAGQVLFGKRRAYQRKVAVADFDGVCSGDIYVFEPADDRLRPELLPFICQTEGFFEHALKTSAGSLSPRTNWKSLQEYEFDLPPVEEQRRIANVLSLTASLTDKQGEAVSAAWSMRMAVYKALARLNWSPAKPTAELPVSWRVATIGEVMRIENRLRKPINAAERAKIAGPYRYYGPTGVFDYISEYRLDGTYALIGEDGDHFLKYGTCSMTQLVHGRFNVNNHAHVLVGTPECSTEWFFHFYRHRDIREWLAKQGSGRRKLKKATLERMPIAIPPEREQIESVSLLSQFTAGYESTKDRTAAALQLGKACQDAILGPK